MNEAERVQQFEPPSGIAAGPFDLDGVTFIPDGRFERATRDGALIGDVLHDDNRFWFARKPDAGGTLSDWQFMRCVHEARAFIVSKIRQPA